LDGEDAVHQSVRLILSTGQGERVMLPDYGCGIYELVFEPNTASLRASVRARVEEALTLHEPRIDVLDVRVETSQEHASQLDIAVNYRIRSNNAVFNLVHPFFLEEGVG